MIRSAKTYTILQNDKGLYLLHVGPAGNQVKSSGPLANYAVKKVHERIAKKVEEGMAKLASIGEDAYASESKGSHHIAPGTVQQVELKKNMYGQPKLMIKWDGGKMTFHFEQASMEEVEKLKSALTIK